MSLDNNIFARSTKLVHPSGISIETPFLIPSFSSKGFGFSKNNKSEIGEIFDVASECLFETMLVSAYDLSCGHLNQIESSITDLTVVDSGGYEISDFQDISTVYMQPVEKKEWSIDKLKNVLDSWPEHIPAIFVSFDHPDIRVPIAQQIESAQALFANHKNQLVCLLIKPETKDQEYVQVKNIINSVDGLASFNVVGLTEKELGSSILERMRKIAEIRLAMDDSGLIGIPIHVFGSLDPITSVLYFISGAEIFDGLTWLRYAYHRGVAAYRQNYAASIVGIDIKDSFVRAKVIQHNLSYLSKMKNQMSKFLLAGSVSMFEDNIISESWDLLRTKVKRLRHGR